MTPSEKELLRHATLETLALRHPVALPVPGIARRLRTTVDFKFTDDDLASALEVLKGLNLIRSQHDDLGASTWWQCTAEGLLKSERSPAS